MNTPWKVVNSPSPVPSPTKLSHGFTIQAPSSSDMWGTPTGPVFTSPMGGLALIIHRPDATRAWVKAGPGFINGEQLVCVAGRDRLPDSSLGTSIMASSDGNAEVTIEMARDDTGLAVFEIQAEGSGPERKRVIRETAWVFAGSGNEECWIGAYAAKPLGDAKDPDIVVRFRDLVVEILVILRDFLFQHTVRVLRKAAAIPDDKQREMLDNILVRWE
ncbi:hypothetical protein ASPVEDRAFT_24861 [Aspergillus versicolor CBS 583.65]|uniref:Uncharacterized protein n=1 Tax=Aspergillus versicolor CBS 583.65 TaxID=1036611 RepID=A0A1L9P8Y6_ASPVE|nr:uncharacterized protein ASPVEDRAFT_24861 [Aspergillus versicolor CBS 583.65]OJI97946.1 hypothetical protein ASPVEDRAFT_24861 [Aspergillus versicolor CBS 583.65]